MNNKGDVFRALTRYEDAVKAYDFALRADAGYIKAWCNKGSALMDMDLFDEVSRHLTPRSGSIQTIRSLGTLRVTLC